MLVSFNSTVSTTKTFLLKLACPQPLNELLILRIGCNLIKQANLTITPDSVMFSKLHKTLSDASPQPFFRNYCGDIPKFDIGPEIPKQTRNDVEALLVCYRPG
ncbi:hypothetical protein TNCV_4173081 [Trichonephila clavipes]|nr:hypothetical protein TNCV_4173081 [Trichonephila clavipes]